MKELTKDILQEISGTTTRGNRQMLIGDEYVYFISSSYIHVYIYGNICIIKNPKPDLYYIENFVYHRNIEMMVDLKNKIAFNVSSMHYLYEENEIDSLIKTLRNKYLLSHRITGNSIGANLTKILDNYMYENNLRDKFDNIDKICALISPIYEDIGIEIIKDYYKGLPEKYKQYIHIIEKIYDIIINVPKIRKIKTIDNKTKYFNVLSIELPMVTTVSADTVKEHISDILKFIEIYVLEIACKIDKDLWKYLRVSRVTLRNDKVLSVLFCIKDDSKCNI